jgi:ATP-binding cassette subfamily B (MDR/TAP) protein 1
MEEVTKIALNFVYLALGAMVGSYLQSAFWMWAGNRQAARFRKAYLAAVLRQDMTYFDTQATTGQFVMIFTD